MNSSLNVGKRAFTTAVAAATMLWSVGFSSFVAPLTARAAAPGDLIKGTTLSTLYYYGSDGKRYAFPDEKTYLSWYSDFSNVQTISDSQLAAIPLGGNIMRRPGSYWVKIQSDPKTYAVTPNGVLRWIETESVATGLAGSNWNQFIQDVPDVFFADYTIGASLSSASAAYNGALVSDGSGNYYEIQNGQKRLVTSAGFTANRLQSRFALSGSGITLSSIAADGNLTSMESSVADPAQLPATAVGGLSVSTASDTPAAQTIPSNASSVTFFKFDLTASSGAATINQIVANLGGIGATGDFLNVYLYDGDTRLTNGRSVNSSTRQVTFSALNISLAAGEVKHMSIRADIASISAGGDTANFSIASASSIVGSASVTGSFPVTGNTMTFSATKTGYITVDKTGTIANPTLGQKDALIGKFKLTAGTEDVSVKSVTLSIDRSGDHSNYKLWQGSTLLAVGTPVTGGSVSDLVSFPLTNPLAIGNGSNAILSVTANIGGRSADDIKIAVDSSTDIVAIGQKYGFNEEIDINSSGLQSTGTYGATGSSCASSSSNCSFSSIIGGKLTFAFNGPTATDIQVDSTNQVFMNLTVTSQNAVELDEIDLTWACVSCTSGSHHGLLYDGDASHTATQANLTNLTIRKADGTTFMGPMELALTDGTGAGDGSGYDASQTLAYKDVQNLAAGQSVDLQVTGNVYSGATAGDAYTVAVPMANIKAKDVNNTDLTNATDIVPTGTLTSNKMTTRSASLTVGVSQPPSNATYVVGTNNVPVLGLSFAAGNASDVTVTDLTESVALAKLASGQAFNTGTLKNTTITSHVSSCSIYDGSSGSLIDGPRSATVGATDSTVATIGFTNFQWPVSAGETGKIITKCNLANVTPEGTTYGDALAFAVLANGDVTANDASGKTLPSVTATNVNGPIDQTVLPTVVVTTAESGSITASIDGSTPKSTIVLGASTAVPVSVYKFQATNEAFTVTDLTLDNCVGGATGSDNTTPSNITCGGSTTGGAVGTDAVSAAVKISYQNKAGDTITKTGFLSGGRVTFSGLDFYVPTSTVRTLSVSIDTNTVSSTSGVPSGSQLQLDLFNNDYATQFKAVGEGSGTTVYTFGSNKYGNVAGNTFTVRKTKPTITLASGSPSGAGVPGLSEVFRFNVSADSRGFVTLDGITFHVTSTDNACTLSTTSDCWNQSNGATGIGLPASWNLYNAANPSTALTSGATRIEDNTGAVLASGTSGKAMSYVQFSLSPAEQIGAGQTNTYSLKADSTGASSVDNDSIRVDIQDQATTSGLSGVARDSIFWQDDVETSASTNFAAASTADDYATVSGGAGASGATLAANAGDETNGVYTNGALIKNLPVTGGTIVY